MQTSNSNGIRLLKGTVEDVQLFGRLLAYGLGGVPCKGNCAEDLAFRTVAYTIPIMGNPGNPKEVTLWIRLDRRNGKDGQASEIRIEHGIEFLEWEMVIGSICNCCTYNKGTARYVCFEWKNPNDAKKQCTSYKFSEEKLKRYFERVNAK